MQSRERDINLSVALAYKRVGSDELAIAAARKVVANDKNSHAALQARSILIELQKGDDRKAELFKLERLCRRKGAHTPANNLALERAEERGMAPAEAEQLLKEVMGFSAKFDDYYNLVRATVRYAEIVVASGRGPTDKERQATLVAYRYLFAERRKDLFDRCHDALWSIFESRAEMNNLFRLFQQSSLMWRLSGDEAREDLYVAKLARYAGAVIQENVHLLSREVAYFLVRRARSGQLQTKPT